MAKKKIVSTSKETPILPIRLPAELRAAAEACAKRAGVSLGELARQALAEKIGRPELAGAVKMGRPTKKDA